VKRGLFAAGTLLLVSGPPGTAATIPGTEWVGFGGGCRHDGVSSVELPGSTPVLRWTFRPDDHVWSYEHGAGPWCASAAICNLPGRQLVIVGSYDHNVYALDLEIGSEVWRFTAGSRIDAAPVVLKLEGRTLVIVVSCDRSIYALDAATGQKVWSFEVFPWSLTVPPAETGSPFAVQVDGRWLVLCTVRINDHKPFANVQKGELLALDGETGDLRWRRTLSSSPLTSPAAGPLSTEGAADSVLAVFVAAEDGCVHALEVSTGEPLWSYRASAPIHSSCALAYPPAGPEGGKLVFGDDFGLVTCLDIATGRQLWDYKAGHAVHATPALLQVGERYLWVFGSFDRRVHAVDAVTGEKAWITATGDLIRASALVTSVGGEPAVAVYSLDRHLHLLAGASGVKIGSFTTGGYLWPLYTRGESIGSSPCAAVAEGAPLLILPGDDGVVYGLGWGP